MTDLELDKTVSRIRKLLALAKGGTTEGEAALAMEKVQELMASANLTMAELEASGAAGGEGSNRVKDGVKNRSPYKWHRKLMEAVAKLNSVYCENIFKRLEHTNQFDGYSLIGREANVVSTRVMFEYLLEAIERVALDEMDAKEAGTRYGHSFKEGAADRIVERLKARREEELRRQETEAREARARQSHPGAAPGNAVVVVMRDFHRDEDDLNNDMRTGHPPGTTAQRRRDAEAKGAELRIKREKRTAELKLQYPDASDDVIWYMAVLDYTLEQAMELCKPVKAKKERKSRAKGYSYRAPKSNLDSAGYYAGRSAGADIGLDRQASHSAKGRLG